MKTSEADFRFPVLGFTPDLEVWGFQDLDRLTRCGPQTLKQDLQRGMELIDAEGHRWRVRSISKQGRIASWRSMLFIFGLPQFRIEHDLDPMEPATLADVRRRAARAMEAFAEDYGNGEDDQAEFRRLLSQVKQASSIAEIYERLQPDTFEAY